MKRLIILAALVVFLTGYPLVNEGAGNACSALEKRWYTVAISAEDKSLVESAVIRSLIEAGEGLLASEYVRKKLPKIPPYVTCYYYYWLSFLDESRLRNIRSPMASEFPSREDNLAEFAVENG